MENTNNEHVDNVVINKASDENTIWCMHCGTRLVVDTAKGEMECNKCGCKTFWDLDYLRASDPASARLNIENLADVKKGDVFCFGRIGWNRLQWKIIESAEGKVEAICQGKYNAYLDNQQFNEEYVPSTWETCSLRRFLNEEFIYAAFSKEERNRIISTEIVCDANSVFGTSGGDSTIDKVFILSESEASQLVNANDTKEKWWLRTPGYSNYAASFYSNGIDVIGEEVNKKGFDVPRTRPVIWIDTSGIQRYKKESDSDIKSNYVIGDDLEIGFDPNRGPIKWRVIDVKDKKVLIITDSIFRLLPFDKKHEDSDYIPLWENSGIRKWLNEDFLNMFLSEDERKRVIDSNIHNDNVKKYDDSIVEAHDTEDKVFLLSEEEAKIYFHDNDERCCEKCNWMLRTTTNSYSVKNIDYTGEVNGVSGYDGYVGIRPAMWIKLEDPTQPDLLTCKKCGSELNSGDKFCRKCGQAVENVDYVTTEIASSADDPLTVPQKANSNMGLCYMCHKRIPISNATKKITCPGCGETGDGSNFIRVYEQEVQFEQLNLAELPFLHEDDEFYFGGLGRYRWNVLNINNGYIFAILSDRDKLQYKKKWKNSDADLLTYNDTNAPVTWESCTLRKWLNETFIERFSDKERELLAPTKVINRNNPFYGTSGGNDTVDKVFCLSIDELRYYCSSDKKKKILSVDNMVNDAYWLRSPGKQQNEASISAATTNYKGEWNPNFTYEVNQSTRHDGYGEDIVVRPCICINTNILKRQERLGSIQTTELNHLDVGQEFTFGFNEFLGAIKWRVIKKENNQLMIITSDLIRRKAFSNDEDKFYSSWESSDIRKWLNNDFLQQYFNDDEVARIVEHNITNNKTKFLQEYIGGKDTVDKVFLLSVEEANALFASDEDRKCLGEWWLRTSRDKDMDSTKDSFEACFAIDVYTTGNINSEYGTKINESIGVRPVMWVRIDN